MGTLSNHPIRYLRTHHPVEYLRVHLNYKEIWTRSHTLLGSLLKKVFESAEKVVAAIMVLLIASLSVFIFMQIAKYCAFAACSYDAAITSIVFPVLEPIPMWM